MANLDDFNINYNEPDEDGYYDNGELVVYAEGKCYLIKLTDSPEYTGYCMCEPSHKGYDPVKACCGIVCDWYRPSISVSKVDDYSFVGDEKDLWEAEKSWNLENEELKQEKIKTELSYIDEQIKDLLANKEALEEHLSK
ncbi:hypothetical protein ACI2JA_03265 [Alkalihalobacillus sp. NPDC078783]